MRQKHTLLVATLAQLELSIAGAVWAAAAPGHRHIARPSSSRPTAGEVRRREMDEC